jgi:predicted ATPase
MDRPVPFISRVRLRNYKSIAECDVELGPLTILVGPNGSGKSNFLDALAFLGRAIATTPYEAINERGGLTEILRRSPRPADSFSIAIEFTVGWGSRPAERQHGIYAFEIASADGSGTLFEVAHEELVLRWDGAVERFEVDHGRVRRNPESSGEVIQSDRLYLPIASARKGLAPFFARLREMRFYQFDVGVLRSQLPPATGSVLGRHGENLGDVLGAMDRGDKERLDAYLRAVAPGVSRIERDVVGRYVTVALISRTGPDDREIDFGPEAMSDGTIRAAGILAALDQPWVLDGRIPLIGIEEPEIALHPAAAGVLFDALTEASKRVQVIVTTQSPDLLDRDDLDISTVRAVLMDHGSTMIGVVDEASNRIIQDKLYTLGELMRGNQLAPEPASEGRSQPED